MRTDTVLITGGLGFIGLRLAERLVAEGRRVRLFDNLNPQVHGDIPDLSQFALAGNPLVDVFRAHVCRPSAWEKALADVRYVVHCAAETGTAQSMYEIARYTNTNVGGTGVMLDYLANRKHKVAKIILASSRAVYGEGAYICNKCGLVYPPMRTEQMLRLAQWEPRCPLCEGAVTAAPTPESAAIAPASIYAATKVAQEDLVRIAAKAMGIPAVILRFQNVYGEGQSLKNPYIGLLSIFSNQLRLGRTLNLYEDGQESRDFVHISDAVRAVELALESDRADGSTLNVGSGQSTTVEEIARFLQEHFRGSTPPMVSGQYRLGDIRHGHADLTAIGERLGYVPEVTLERGLDRFADWVSTQPIEPDRLEAATQELVGRGLMQTHVADKPTSV